LPASAHTEDNGIWKPGDFRMDYDTARRYMTEQGVDWTRVHLIKGWFNDTLNQGWVSEHNITHASIIMVDCDLYSSAKEALEFCAPLIRDHAVILFDDWFAGDLAENNLGEKKAFAEFLSANPALRAEEGETYIRTAKVFRIGREPNGAQFTAI
jgi:predicted O-methyltransferase YrrM